MMKKIVRPFRAECVPKPILPSLGGFSSFRPLDLEIGCGVGLHPIRYAQKHPERDLVAIEHTSIKFEKFRGRLDRHPPLKNLLPVHGNAISWVTHYAPEAVFEHVFLLYPNPNHDWYRLPFMHQLIRVMKKSGVLELRTNLKEYAGEALIYFSEAFGLELVEQAVLLKENVPIPATHFEKKYLERGEPCYLQRWKKSQ